MRTPLYDRHLALKARMAPFGGWDMPIQYAGILAEHEWTRRQVSVFDTCHMGEFEVQGPQAEADLDRLLTQNVRGIKTSQCRYGYLLREDGGVLDDLICCRRGPDRFWIVVNAGTRAGDADWIRARLSPGTRFTDLSDRLAKLDVQGPASRPVLEAVLGARLPDLGYFFLADGEYFGMPFTVSRTGYTGEWGYELFFPRDRTVEVWDRLTASGAIRPAGLGARDTLRLEVGYPLYGHELGPERTPIAAARGTFIDFTKDFTGKAACRRDLDGGCPRYLAGLRLENKRAARAGDQVFAEGREVGAVTSGSLAPSLGIAVALAYLDKDLTAPDTAVEIESHGKRLPAKVSPVPFYTAGTARRRTP